MWKEEPLTKSFVLGELCHNRRVVYVSLLYLMLNQQTTLVTQGACLARPLKLIVVLIVCFAHPVGMSRTTVLTKVVLIKEELKKY